MTKTFRPVVLWLTLLVVIFLAWHFAQLQREEEVMPFATSSRVSRRATYARCESWDASRAS